MSELEDRAGPVRPGEELDAERLETYLEEHLPGVSPPIRPLRLRQFTSGYSNLTYLLELGPEGEGRELVLRRPPFGSRVETAHDMAREHRVLSHLHRVYPLAPEPYLYCEDPAILGAPFYVMERRRGVILHRGVQQRLKPPPAVARRLSESFLDNLAALHRLDVEAAGLGDLGRPQGYTRRQVDGWRERYQRARTHHWPEVEEIQRWLGEHLPADAGAALIHNDYKYDNLVLDPDELPRIRAVLDWEMCTVGDPLMDLGTTLAYWIDPGETSEVAGLGLLPAAFPGSLTRRQLAERYARATGAAGAADPGALLFYYAFGLFKIAVIAQQIYVRYTQGHTRDERFARLHHAVAALGRRAMAAVQEGTL